VFDLPKYGGRVCLARMAELLDALSVDRERLQRTSVVVTGSNGKGSTAAFCAASLSFQRTDQGRWRRDRRRRSGTAKVADRIRHRRNRAAQR
jgi:hypothetical protein